MTNNYVNNLTMMYKYKVKEESMDIKDIESQKETFINYTDQFSRVNDETKINGYIDKQNHSLFVLDEALLIDAIFTKYN